MLKVPILVTRLILNKLMANQITIKNKIEDFNKSITVSGDKSLSIRWVLFSSIANGIQKLIIYFYLKMFWLQSMLLKN
jgi:hypothetical protein